MRQQRAATNLSWVLKFLQFSILWAEFCKQYGTCFKKLRIFISLFLSTSQKKILIYSRVAAEYGGSRLVPEGVAALLHHLPVIFLPLILFQVGGAGSRRRSVHDGRRRSGRRVRTRGHGSVITFIKRTPALLSPLPISPLILDQKR